MKKKCNKTNYLFFKELFKLFCNSTLFKEVFMWFDVNLE